MMALACRSGFVSPRRELQRPARGDDGGQQSPLTFDGVVERPDRHARDPCDIDHLRGGEPDLRKYLE